MPAPATVDELLDLVVKSGVTDDARLKAYTQKLASESAMPADPSKMAGQLVRDGHLTYFQAEQLLQGKWKRFTIGKYKVLERLGAGGMGQVFLCEHKFMRRRVAVKVLPTAKAEDPASLDRFYREARAVAAVDHPNLVRAYDIDQDDNLHFLVMEYVDGTNLQDLVKKAGPLDILRACHYIYGSSIGLQHAHEVGLVHRDIKPGNILVDRSGMVKILDLGLARFFHDEADDLTKKYDENVLGTADYLAPEQALESHTVDIRADIYSLGATFYFLLTGSAPFPEGSVAQKLIWHQTRTPKSVKEIRPEVPDDVLAVVERMMAKDAAQRFQTPAEVMSALAERVSTPIPPPSERELPQLSPAALVAGGQGIRPPTQTMTQPPGRPTPQGPVTFAGSGPPTGGGTWHGSSPATSQGTMVDPNALSTTPGGGGVWEGLSSDTQDLEGSDTDRPAIVSPSSMSSQILSSAAGGSRAGGSRAGGSKVGRKRRVPVWGMVGGALVLAVGAAVVLFNLVFKSPSPGDQSPGTTIPPSVHVPRTLYVSRRGGENTWPTLQRALAEAKPGDRVEIKEETISETVTGTTLRIVGPKYKDVVITSSLLGNVPAVIELGGGDSSNPTLPMIELTNVEGLTIRNVIIEGKGNFASGIAVTGNSPGTTIDNVSVRGCTYGVRLEDAAGTPERPIVLEKLHLQVPAKVKYAIGVLASPDKAVRNAVIRYNRLEGISVRSTQKDKDGKEVFHPSTGFGIQISGPCENVSIVQNRIFNVTRAVNITELAEGGSLQVLIENNTIHSTRIGIMFEVEALSKSSYNTKLRRNLFVKTDAIAKSNLKEGTIAGFETDINVKDSLSRDSNLPSKAIPVDGAVPQRPGAAGVKDTDFLRIQKGSKIYDGLLLDKERIPVGFTGYPNEAPEEPMTPPQPAPPPPVPPTKPNP